jgi:hypothetical protein
MEKEIALNSLTNSWAEVFTHHAEWRMAQRNLCLEDILFVLDHGERLYRAGAIFFYLRKCDIPKDLRRKFGRLEGTTVVMSREMPLVLTVYRNRQKGLRHVKRKSMRGHSLDHLH